MKNRTGAVFIAFGAYTNEDGEQAYARYEYTGLQNKYMAHLYLDMRAMD